MTINIAELPLDLPIELRIKIDENPLRFSYYHVTPVSDDEKQRALAQGYNEIDDQDQFWNIHHHTGNEFILKTEEYKSKHEGKLPPDIYNWDDHNFFERVEVGEEPLPDFPRFTGSLGDLASVVAPDLPYEFKVMAAITHWGLLRSGVDKLEDEPYLQPRFYVCLHAKPERGKSGSLNEIKNIMEPLSRYQRYTISPSVDSGPALVDEFQDITKMTVDGKDKPAHLLLNVDEMSDLFQKAKVTPNGRNTLFDELIKLFEHNTTGNRSRRAGRTQIENAHLAIIGGTQPERYTNMWMGTGGGSSGLQSRFVVITHDKVVPKPQKPTNGEELPPILQRLTEQAQLPGQTIRKSPEAERMLATWWRGQKQDGEAETRVHDIMMRLLIVLAVTNDTDIIDTDLMRQAIEFGAYVIAARRKLNPADSANWVQGFENLIMAAYHQHKLAMTARDYLRAVHPERKPGGVGSYNQAWRNLLAAGVLLESGKTTTRNTPKYKVTI